MTSAEANSTPDPVLGRIAAAVAADHHGDRPTAERQLHDLWRELTHSEGDSLHVCAAAHALADLQSSAREELRWDLIALRAASSVTDARLQEAGASITARGLLPSLHVNVADAYLRLGDRQRARQHVRLGTDTLQALGDGAYAQALGDALARISGRLQE